jgi:hypothetical protein
LPKLQIAAQSAAALANGNAVAAFDPAAAVNFKLLQLILGCGNSGGAITDFDIVVGFNRATARGTATTTGTGSRTDPNSAASAITGVDTAWSVQPTLAAADFLNLPFNSRGGLVLNFNVDDIISNVGTANPLVLVQRSGAALPASHYITVGAEWLE